MAYDGERGQTKVYVKVNSDFDTTGYMLPRSITWQDGRSFPIDSVRDCRPVSDRPGRSCYTILIKGAEKHLYFEKSEQLHASCCGRWWVDSAS